MKRLMCAGVLLAILIPAGTAGAADIQVPGDYATIQEAIDAAVDGDVVVVAPGTYAPTATLAMKVGVAVQGAGADSTIIECGDSPCVHGASGGGELSNVRLLTTSGGSGVTAYGTLSVHGTVIEGAATGISVYGGTLDSNVLLGCDVGIYAHGRSPRILHNVFVNNGMGVRMHFVITTGGQQNANPDIEGNIFQGCTTAIHNRAGSPSNNYTKNPVGNLFFGNDADSAGFTLQSADNLTGDPLFVAFSDDGDYSNDDFHISSASPCVDGLAAFSPASETPPADLDGELRPSGAAADCGADELHDLDGDGDPDRTDPDLDGDGVPNDTDTMPYYTDNDGEDNVVDTDDDGDGMLDAWEEDHGLNPVDASDAAQDADGDGATNLEEHNAGTDPNDASDVPGGGVDGGVDGGSGADAGTSPGTSDGSGCSCRAASPSPGGVLLLLLAVLLLVVRRRK